MSNIIISIYNNIIKRYLYIFVILLGILMVIISGRIIYPYELEWMEGGSLEVSQRILEGKDIYCEPSIEYIPFIYTPLYFYVSAVIMKITGYSFLACRFISLLSLMGLLLIIQQWIKRETRNPWTGLAGAAFFMVCYNVTGQWYDIARVDMLFCFLLASAFYQLRFREGWKGIIISAVIAWLAWFSKQTTLMVVAPMMVYLLLKDWKKGMGFIALFILLISGTTFYMDYASHGWFSRYVYKIPSGHPILNNMIWEFWLKDIGLKLLIALGLCVFGLLGYWKKERVIFGYYLAFGLGAVGASWASKMHEGGDVNVLIPMILWMALLFGISIHQLSARFQDYPLYSRKYVAAFISLLIISQLIILQRDPRKFIPDNDHYSRMKSFESYLSGLKGTVYLPCHGYLMHKSGQPAYANLVAGWDILRSKDKDSKEILIKSIRTCLEKHEFDWIILDSNDIFFIDLKKYYKKELEIPSAIQPADTVTGYKSHPQYVYVPLRVP